MVAVQKVDKDVQDVVDPVVSSSDQRCEQLLPEGLVML